MGNGALANRPQATAPILDSTTSTVWCETSVQCIMEVTRIEMK